MDRYKVMNQFILPIVVFFTYLILSALVCSNFFSFFDLDSHCMTDGDPALNAWTLQWVSHSLFSDPSQLFHGNAFYPYRNTIALTEHLFSLAVFNSVFRLFSPSPWFGYNILIFLSYLISCWAGYAFIFYITGSKGAAFWGGLFWGFLFFRVHHIGHLHILSYQWIPFCALYLAKGMEKPCARNLFLLLGFFLLQSLTGWYLAVIIGFILLLFVPFHLELRPLNWIQVKQLVLFATLAVILLLPFGLPYLETMKSSSLSQRMEIAATGGDYVKLKDYLVPPFSTLAGQALQTKQYWIWEENTLYIGYVPLILSVLSVVLFLIKPNDPSLLRWKRYYFYPSLTLVLVGYVLAQGFVSPTWGFKFPLYYLSQVFPFLKAFRATQRFSLMIYFGILTLSALFTAFLLRKVSNSKVQALLLLCLSLAFLLEVYPYKLPLNPHARYEFSSIDRFICRFQSQTNRRVVTVHYPIYSLPGGSATREAEYMVGSTRHWAHLVNGYAEFPRGHMKDIRLLSTLPGKEALTRLAELKVDLICLHSDAPRKEEILRYFRNRTDAKIEELEGEQFVIVLNGARLI